MDAKALAAEAGRKKVREGRKQAVQGQSHPDVCNILYVMVLYVLCHDTHCTEQGRLVYI